MKETEGGRERGYWLNLPSNTIQGWKRQTH